jgi:hypothetical protein
MSHYTPGSYEYNQERRREALEALKKAKAREQSPFRPKVKFLKKEKL